MGLWYSRPPWRNVEWKESTRQSLKKSVQEYTPIIKSVPQARILLVGDVNAGKSSFFNSINSVFCGKLTGQANAGPNDTSLTLKYRTYKVREGRGGRALSFLLCDTMGLEADKVEEKPKANNLGEKPKANNLGEKPKANKGVCIDDIESILKGYIPDGYQFNPKTPWSLEGDQCHILPLKERIHCLVFVVDASTLPLMNSVEKKKEKFIQIRDKANLLEVPVMVLLTKVDKVCPHVEKHLKNVYWSKYLKEQFTNASELLGIQVSNVFPVKNYCHEDKLDMCCDILLLTAMQKMLHLADDFFANFEEE